LHISDRLKSMWVQGDRIAHFVPDGNPSFSDPLPFETLELRYERAYGGTDVYSDKRNAFGYPRNPCGRGFVVANTAQTVNGLPLPNFEDPNDLLTPDRLCIGAFDRWASQPKPWGFGWNCKTWMDRAQYAGVMPGDRAVEQELRQAYAALVPIAQRQAYLDHPLPVMDFRFFQGASNGLSMPFLAGDEPIHTENLHPDGSLAFKLPGDRPTIELDIGFGSQQPPAVLHTVLIRMDDHEVDLVWRAAVTYPGPAWLPQMRTFVVQVDQREAIA
jgi:hypothetical protein